jgi:hypothetical protein
MDAAVGRDWEFARTRVGVASGTSIVGVGGMAVGVSSTARAVGSPEVGVWLANKRKGVGLELEGLEVGANGVEDLVPGAPQPASTSIDGINKKYNERDLHLAKIILGNIGVSS